MPITPEQLVHAFAEIINKRALLDAEYVPKLVRLALQAGVHDATSLYQWIGSTPKLTNELRSELLNILREPRQRRYGAFTVVGHLADGGMGDVWLAINDDGELGVVKTLLSDLHSDDEFVRRFQREAQITARFTSPYLVRCLDQGQSSDQDSSLYITLEYVAGGDLHNLICTRSHLSEVETLRIGRQVALALEEADRLNLVHRDIKPENILITAKGDAKLVDFGLARTTSADRTVLTLAGSTLGTPDYMSPEQIYGDQDLDIRSDIYALGCVLFFCLAGHPPYEGDSIDIMKNHISGEIPDIRRVNRSISKQTKLLIDRCMAKKRDQRFPTAGELAEACGAAMERQGTKRYDTTMRGIRLSEILPPPQFSSDSIMDLAEIEAPAVAAHLGEQRPGIPPSGQDWLVLSDPSSGLTVHLLGKRQLLMGKLRAPPVDICLRNYPKESFAELNNRISRQHCQLQANESGVGYCLVDCGSTNGLIVNGTRIPAHTPWPIQGSGMIRVSVPKSLTFGLRHFGQPRPYGVIITRPDNHPQISYVLINGPLSLGGNDCDLVLVSKAAADQAVIIMPTQTGWLWQASGQQDWNPINDGQSLRVADCQLQARWGNYDDFA